MININLFHRSYILKTVMHIATTRKCIIMIDTTLGMRNQKDQHAEEQKDTETRMHQNGHCTLN